MLSFFGVSCFIVLLDFGVPWFVLLSLFVFVLLLLLFVVLLLFLFGIHRPKKAKQKNKNPLFYSVLLRCGPYRSLATERPTAQGKKNKT